MLGGGTFVTQNKVLAGSYINVINAKKATSSVGERGVVAIVMEMNGNNTVIELTSSDFVKNCKDILGFEYDSSEAIYLREIFRHANKVYILDTDDTISNLSLLDAYDFNVLCAYVNKDSGDGLQQAYVEYCKTCRDTIGKKFQVVVHNYPDANHEGVINVTSRTSDVGTPSHALTAWVSGLVAGCPINESCTNALYDGEYTIKTDKTQSQLEECINNGEFVFHRVYGEIRVLEDINSLKDVTADKGEDFKSNQTIRVIDQIANDIAKLYNTKYLGRVQNNASGRVSLWNDIVSHHRQLEEIGAIENFDATLVTVEQGTTKKSVVVNDVITVVNAMSQLYMTVVVQ